MVGAENVIRAASLVVHSIMSEAVLPGRRRCRRDRAHASCSACPIWAIWAPACCSVRDRAPRSHGPTIDER